MIYSMNGHRAPERQQLQQASVFEVESRVSIKTEPDSGENTPQQCARSPVEHFPTKPTTLFPGGKSTGPPKTKRRRYSIPTSLSSGGPRSSSYSDDAGDDLSLSAEDCISGVISTPPIKPLEEGDDVMTTPSPTTNVPLAGPKRNDARPIHIKNRVTPSPPIESAAPSQLSRAQTGPPVSKNSENNFTPKGDSLFQDLDDFTRVMEMVTKEQLAKERQASLDLSTSQQLVNDRHSPPQRMTPPYYPSVSQLPNASIPNGGPPQATRHLPTTQSNYVMQQQQFKHPITPVPRRASTQEPVLENRHLPRPPSLLDMQAHKHPRPMSLTGVSPQVESPQLMSPTILPTAQTPITTPGYPNPSTHCTMSVPDHPHMSSQPPRTPTTPLEHFSTFSLQPTQQSTRSPTQSRPFFPPSSSSVGSYPFPPHRLSSPSGVPNTTWPAQTQQTHAHLNSPQGSLNETLMARVNSNLEMITGQKRPPPTQGQGWSLGAAHSNEMSMSMPPFSSQYSGVGTTRDSLVSGLAPAPSLSYHNHSTLPHSYNHHHSLWVC